MSNTGGRSLQEVTYTASPVKPNKQGSFKRPTATASVPSPSLRVGSAVNSQLRGTNSTSSSSALASFADSERQDSFDESDSFFGDFDVDGSDAVKCVPFTLDVSGPSEEKESPPATAAKGKKETHDDWSDFFSLSSDPRTGSGSPGQPGQLAGLMSPVLEDDEYAEQKTRKASAAQHNEPAVMIARKKRHGENVRASFISTDQFGFAAQLAAVRKEIENEEKQSGTKGTDSGPTSPVVPDVPRRPDKTEPPKTVVTEPAQAPIVTRARRDTSFLMPSASMISREMVSREASSKRLSWYPRSHAKDIILARAMLSSSEVAHVDAEKKRKRSSFISINGVSGTPSGDASGKGVRTGVSESVPSIPMVVASTSGQVTELSKQEGVKVTAHGESSAETGCDFPDDLSGLDVMSSVDATELEDFDLEGDEMDVLAGARKTITGISANKEKKETGWEDDFDFDDDDGFSVKGGDDNSVESKAERRLSRTSERGYSLLSQSPAGSTTSKPNEPRDISDAKYLLSCIPDTVKGFGNSAITPLWTRQTADDPFPDWMTKEHAEELAEQYPNFGIAFSSWIPSLVAVSRNRYSEALSLYNKARSKMGDTLHLLDADVVSFGCLMYLHSFYCSKQVADIFNATNSLRRGLTLANNFLSVVPTLPVPPSQQQLTRLKSIVTALNYELASTILQTDPETALQHAVSFLRSVVVLSGPKTEICWINVFRALLLVARCIPTAYSNVASLFVHKAVDVAQLIGDESLLDEVKEAGLASKIMDLSHAMNRRPSSSSEPDLPEIPEALIGSKQEKKDDSDDVSRFIRGGIGSDKKGLSAGHSRKISDSVMQVPTTNIDKSATTVTRPKSSLENELELPQGKTGKTSDSSGDKVDDETKQTTGKAPNDDDDFDFGSDEDWDAEFGIEAEPVAISLHIGVSDVASSHGGDSVITGDGVSSPQMSSCSGIPPPSISPSKKPSGTPVHRSVGFPQKYRVLDNIFVDSVELVRFPQPPHLFSLKTAQGVSFMHAEEFEGWLVNIVAKHVYDNMFKSVDPSMRPGKAVEGCKKRFKSEISKLTKYSREWFARHINWAREMCSLGEMERGWGIIYQMILRDIRKFLDELETGIVKCDKARLKSVYDICFQALLFASGLWSIEHNAEWIEMCDVCKLVYPAYAEHVDELTSAIVIEHIMRGSDEEFEMWDQNEFYPSPVVDLLTLFTKNRDIFKEQKDTDKASKSGGPLSVMASALADIHLTSLGISPLTYEEYGSYPEEEELNTELEKYPEISTESGRLSLLKELYPLLSTSITKGKVAYVFAREAVIKEQWDVAEQLFFEALYIVDEVSMRGSGFKLIPFIATDFGLQTLIRFGDVLLHNDKYQFALPCYEAAILLCDLALRKEYFKLVPTVAEIARENNDLEHCTDLYQELVKKYVAFNKQDEAVYVYSVLANIQERHGDFEDAEASCLAALDIILPPRDTPRTVSEAYSANPQVFNILILLATLLLHGFHQERGIRLLETMDSVTLSSVRQKQLLLQLSNAFSWKGWFEDAIGTFNRICSSSDPHESLPNTKTESLQQSDSPPIRPSAPTATTETQSSSQVTPTTPSASALSTNSSITSTMSLNMTTSAFESIYPSLELLIRAYLYSSRYSECLHILNYVIQLCPSTHFRVLGYLYSHRGSVLSSLFRLKHTLVFPSTLTTPVPELEKVKGLPVFTPTDVTFTRATDIIQEAAACYRKAYECFLNIGDDVCIAETMNDLAHLYLECLFPSCCLRGMSREDASVFPLFSSSIYPSDSGSEDFQITDRMIENPAEVALDISSELVMTKFIPHALLNMAELNFLKGDMDLSMEYWKECRDLLWALYMDGPVLIVKDYPLQALEKIVTAIERLTRLLVCFESEFINRNLIVLDACLLAQMDLQQARERPLYTGTLFSSRNFTVAAKSSSSEGPSADVILSIPRIGDDFVSISVKESKKSSTSHHTREGSQGSGSLSAIAAAAIQASTSDSEKTDSGVSSGGESSTGTVTGDSSKSGGEKTTKENDTDDISILHAQSSEKLWSIEACIRNTFRDFAAGKITKSDLISHNQELFRDHLKVASQARRKDLHAGPLIADSRISSFTSLLDVTDLYSFTSFSLHFPNVVSRLAYVIQFGTMVVYYAPASGKIHVDIFEASKTSEDQSVVEKNESWENGYRVNFHLLSHNEEYVTLDVCPSCTIGEVLDEVCHQYSKYTESSFGSMGVQQAAHSSGLIQRSGSPGSPHMTPVSKIRVTPPGGPSSPPSPNSSANSPKKTPESPTAKRLSGIVKDDGRRGVTKQRSDSVTRTRSCESISSPEQEKNKRTKLVGTTPKFWNELGKLASKIQGEDKSSGPLGKGRHRRGLNFCFRLSGSQLALARTQNNCCSVSGTLPYETASGEPTEHKFIPLSLPQTSLLISCLSSREAQLLLPHTSNGDITKTKHSTEEDGESGTSEKSETEPASESGSESRSDSESEESEEQKVLDLYIYASTGKENPMTFSSRPRMIPEETGEYMLSLINSSGEKQADKESVKDIQQFFQTSADLQDMFCSLLDIIPVNPDPESKKRDMSPMPGVKTDTTGVTTKRFGSIRGFFTSKEKTDKLFSVRKNSVSTDPVIVLTSPLMHVIPWELVMPSDIVLRYWSFFDLTQSANSMLHTNSVSTIPSYFSVYYHTADQGTKVCEEKRRKHLVFEVEKNVFMKDCKVIENHSRQNATFGMFQSPLVEIQKRNVVVPKKKYKYLHFFDLSTIGSNPEDITIMLSHRSDPEEGTFPVLVASHADLVDPSAPIFAIVRKCPSVTVLGVPPVYTKIIIKKLMTVQESFIKSLHRIDRQLDFRDRYQFLLSIIQAVKKDSCIPIAILNPPVAFPPAFIPKQPSSLGQLKKTDEKQGDGDDNHDQETGDGSSSKEPTAKPASKLLVKGVIDKDD